MLVNLSAALPALLDLVRYVAYMMGAIAVAFGIGGLMKLSGDPRESTSKPTGELVVGGAFLAIDYWLPMLISTFTSDVAGISNILSYSGANSGTNAMGAMFKSVMMFAQFLGVIGILKGMHLFKKASNPVGQNSGEDAAIAGMWFIVFGSFAANITFTLQMASSFLGFPLPSFIVS